ncbi:type II toxin-antitoxin system RelE/ParE family toxin [Candidatus Gracilibacteria bacterium]|nr:type II toxin-antitoxin system RelE/ParE family toxin [Candidatus Gracilibacteria bacterium]
MDYKVFYTKSAEIDLEKIGKFETKKITQKIDYYLENKNPIKLAKKLKNCKIDTYRFRVGDFRVIFRLDKNGKIIILVILKIAHRKEVYKT